MGCGDKQGQEKLFFSILALWAPLHGAKVPLDVQVTGIMVVFQIIPGGHDSEPTPLPLLMTFKASNSFTAIIG